MSTACGAIHQLVWELDRHAFPFDAAKISLNGIYVLFQKGEQGHQGERIVRVGTHTGNNQLRSRLQQNFLVQKKDRSIFRKNIGRALLSRNNDPFLEHWELDLTTRKAKEKYLPLIDFDYQTTRMDTVLKNIQRQRQRSRTFI